MINMPTKREIPALILLSEASCDILKNLPCSENSAPTNVSPSKHSDVDCTHGAHQKDTKHGGKRSFSALLEASCGILKNLPCSENSAPAVDASQSKHSDVDCTHGAHQEDTKHGGSGPSLLY